MDIINFMSKTVHIKQTKFKLVFITFIIFSQSVHHNNYHVLLERNHRVLMCRVHFYVFKWEVENNDLASNLFT